MRIDSGGITLDVTDTGEGPPVLLLHGWPDTHDLWRHQVAALTAAGYRTITPDLRGFGASGMPDDVAAYGIEHHVGDVLGVLDHLGIAQAHLVGHDWGGAIAAVTAALVPDRFTSLTCLSVGHPGAFGTDGFAQREKSWYMLLFQFPGVAEQWLTQDGCANFRAWSGHPEADDVAARWADPAVVTAGLSVYRAVMAPEALVVAAGRGPAHHRADPRPVVHRRHGADRGDDGRDRQVRGRPLALRAGRGRRPLAAARRPRRGQPPPPRPPAGGRRLTRRAAPGAQVTALVRNPAAATHASVRTWFPATHGPTNVCQAAAALDEVASTASRALLRGMWNAPVSTMTPSR